VASSHLEPTRLLELETHEDGRLTISGVVRAGGRPSAFRLIERKPVEIVAAVERWLDDHDGGAITIVVRGPAVSIATWTTRSTSMALYWLATILGKVWVPAFKVEQRTDGDSTVAASRPAQLETGPVSVAKPGRNKVA
jgi:hypothetical protein